MSKGYKASRLAAKLSQQNAAEKLGVGIVTLSRWETGKTSPNAVQLKAMAQLYGTTVDALIADERSALQ